MITQTSSTIQFRDDSQFSLIWDGGLLKKIEWLTEHSGSQGDAPVCPAVQSLIQQLRNYFSLGSPLESVPWNALSLENLTEFQIAVYRAITVIPHGETRTYAWVALKVGKPLAARAVGQALRKNPFPILIPCHRVVSGQGLGGFMGTNDPSQTEMKLKYRLLELERNYVNPFFSFMAAV